MSESAIGTQRRVTTAERIHRCAQQLTDEHGLDGFTMDDLAEAADVSRRTVFNYYPSKLDAVLGEWPILDADDVATFRAGGPHGDLLSDLYVLILPLLETKVPDRAGLAIGRRIMLAEPRLMVQAHHRYVALSQQVIEYVQARPGSTLAHGQVAVSILGALFDAALESFLRDTHDRTFAEHFNDCLSTARHLLGAR